MKVEFSQHCLDQLKIRSRISKSMIISTVTLPEEVIESYRDRKLYRKTFESDTLEVVAFKGDNTVTIITAYILGQQP